MVKKQPTLRDILEGMNTRFNVVFKELKRIDGRFELIYPHLSALRKDVTEIKEVQKADGEILDEIRDEMEAISKAVDKDAVAILDHENRITKLERAR